MYASSSSAPSVGNRGGTKAKKLYLDDHPGYTFPKKDVYANGQLVQANRWLESMRPYLERALEAL